MIEDEILCAIRVLSSKSFLIGRKDIEHEIENHPEIYPLLTDKSDKSRRIIIGKLCNRMYEQVFLSPPCWNIRKPLREKVSV
jgi:hypothetical protein